MATEQHFSIRKGRTCSITVNVTDVSDYTGLVAKLFASYDDSEVELVLDGTIDPVANTITFATTAADTASLEAQSSLRYEVSLYKADGSYVKDTNYGLINIGPVVNEHPNI
jgi:hypothetical protein